MSKKPDGGPAFPAASYLHRGMSLRDYFAAHAPERPGGWWPTPRPERLETWSPELHAAWAFAYADAMLAERDK